MLNLTTKNRFALIAIVAICLAPVLVAWLIYKNPEWLTNKANYGTLITPAFKIDPALLTGADSFSRNNVNEYTGRWVMMHLIASERCDIACSTVVNATKHIRLMLNKDLLRVRRIVVVSDKMAGDEAQSIWADDPTLLRFTAGSELFDQVANLISKPVTNGILFLVDPLSNLMMWYKPGFDPYGVKKDMKKLLDVSQIG